MMLGQPVSFTPTSHEKFSRNLANLIFETNTCVQVRYIKIYFRCLRKTCRGIHFEAGTWKLLFDTNDVPLNERTKYNQVDLSGNSELLINGRSNFSLLRAIMCSLSVTKLSELNLFPQHLSFIFLIGPSDTLLRTTKLRLLTYDLAYKLSQG